MRLVSVLAWSLIAIAASPNTAAGTPWRTLVEPECILDLGRVQPQHPKREPNQFYLMVRHQGEPGGAEWLGQVANPVSWDVGLYSGWRPPLPYATWQRGYYDLGPPSGTSAVQLHCRQVGFMLNTYSYTRTSPIDGGGPNIAFEHAFAARPRVWSGADSVLRFELDLKLPWLYDPEADHAAGLGVAQVSLFYYAQQRRTGRVFAHVIALFDSRPNGVGNGREFVGHDTNLFFASSPLADLDADTHPVRFVQPGPGSGTFRNRETWSDATYFSAQISRGAIERALEALSSSDPGFAVAPDELALLSVGMLIEVFPGFGDQHNLSVAGSMADFRISTGPTESIFVDDFDDWLNADASEPATKAASTGSDGLLSRIATSPAAAPAGSR
jgi:hypothetical protein